jgi:hypothetical protein
MKTQVKTVKALAAAILLSGLVFGASARINVDSFRNIELQEPSAMWPGYTDIYGSLWLFNTTANSNVGHLFTAGDVYASKDIYGRQKFFVHPHPTEVGKVIKYITVESGEALTVVRGKAKTENGAVTVKLPEHFSLVTSKKEPITVILTPIGVPALLYTKQSSRYEVVIAADGEYRDVEFAYQVTGVRDGFENQVVIVDEEKLGAPIADSEKNEVQKRIDEYNRRVWEREKLERNKVRTETIESPEEYIEIRNTEVIRNTNLNKETVIVQAPNQAVRNNTNEKVADAAPAKALTAEFVAGPNPADRRAGAVMNFYYRGQSIKSGQLTIYNSSGNIINRIKLSDKTLGDQTKGQAGSWNLTDRRGRLVPEGTYLVRGTLVTSDGKREIVAVTVGVR